MKGKLRRFGILMIVCVSLLLSSCAEESEIKYSVPDTMANVEDKVIAENDKYSLEWDDKKKCVFMRSLDSGFVWSTTPYDYYLAGGSNYNLCSPIMIEYYNTEDGSINTLNASECIDYGMVSAQKTQNGIKVSFYFDEVKITVSVLYTLREDSLLISFNTSDIEEAGTNQLLNVSLAPYLCAVKNTENRSSYLFVPSGSGALMYTDTSPNENPRSFSGEVYGNDPVRKQLAIAGAEEPIRLPVFGAKNGGNALFSVIEKGDGAARINALSGNPANGYSAVYATFNVRGYNNAELGTGSTIILSKSKPNDFEFAVGYYPLTGENADYSGMADCYRKILKNTEKLKMSKQKQAGFHINVLGGAEIDTYTLGIPHKSLLSLTTFSEAREILEELVKTVERKPEVKLSGFGKTGLNAGKVAGGFEFANALNKNKGQQDLEKYCGSENISLFTDFDLICFSQSGNGFSVLKNSALTANMQGSALYPVKRNVLTENEEARKIRILERSKLVKAADKLADFCDERISGVGLSSLGKTAYSDYSEEKYMLKGYLFEQMCDVLSKFQNHNITLSAANGYAAGLADSITDVPLQNGSYDALDETVPFYAMVYRGSIPLYSTPINLSPNPKAQLLNAVEAGVSPSFMLSRTYDSDLSVSDSAPSSRIVFKNNKGLICNIVEASAGFFEKISDAVIISHKTIQTGVTQTLFDNGVSVTVNHNDTAVKTEKNEIAAMSFIFEE